MIFLENTRFFYIYMNLRITSNFSSDRSVFVFNNGKRVAKKLYSCV